MPGNTQKILTEIWHHFWLKMTVKSGLEKNILKFNGGLQCYLPTCHANSSFLGRFFCTGQQQLWRPSWNFEIIFLDHFSPSFLIQKWCQISVRIFCVLSGTRNLLCNTMEYGPDIHETLLGLLREHLYWYWSLSHQPPLDSMASKRSHCAFFPYLFHGQMTQIFIDHLSSPEGIKSSLQIPEDLPFSNLAFFEPKTH